MRRYIATGLSLPTEIVRRIDDERGDISRSRFLLRIIQRAYQYNQNKVEDRAQMDNTCPACLPDIIINICPLGCDIECAKIWMNESIGNRIICRCLCGHNKKQVALQLVGGPEAKATEEILPSSQERTPNDD
jgi:hypothetical protein